ncbi:MAG: DedA family protein [Pseudonocardia sp.]
MVDVEIVFGAVLHSIWLLPVLAVLIAIDGPLPVLPSETLLMSAFAVAFVEQDGVAVLGFFLAALVGSVIGDLAVFGLGRSSNRMLADSFSMGRVDYGLSTWVRRHLLGNPGFTLVGARFVPGGRLVSTAAAGRYGLGLLRFLPWSVASSAAWSIYMLLVGLLLGPLSGGSPLLALLAGVVMAILTAGAFALIGVVRTRRGSCLPAGPTRPRTRALPGLRRTHGGIRPPCPPHLDQPVPAEAPRSAGTGHSPQRSSASGVSVRSQMPTNGGRRSPIGAVLTEAIHGLVPRSEGCGLVDPGERVNPYTVHRRS